MFICDVKIFVLMLIKVDLVLLCQLFNQACRSYFVFQKGKSKKLSLTSTRIELVTSAVLTRRYNP